MKQKPCEDKRKEVDALILNNFLVARIGLTRRRIGKTCLDRSRGGITLLASLASTFFNLVLLEPRSTSIMLAR